LASRIVQLKAGFKINKSYTLRSWLRKASLLTVEPKIRAFSAVWLYTSCS